MMGLLQNELKAVIAESAKGNDFSLSLGDS